jgi:hypothetical protein
VESFEFFVGVGGVFGAINTPDIVSLNRMMVGHRLNWGTALGQWRETMSQMMGGAPGSGVKLSH